VFFGNSAFPNSLLPEFCIICLISLIEYLSCLGEFIGVLNSIPVFIISAVSLKDFFCVSSSVMLGKVSFGLLFKPAYKVLFLLEVTSCVGEYSSDSLFSPISYKSMSIFLTDLGYISSI